MSVLVLQLGDIHIKVDSDEILRRGEQIAAAAAAEADSEVDAACILVTGDVAQTGAEEEFRLAIEFLSAIRDGLAKKLGCPVQIITIPGNHDLHLADDQTARNQIIDGISTATVPPPSILDIVLASQRNYFAFADKISAAGQQLTYAEPFFRTVRIQSQNGTLDLHLVNSAWMSTRHESPGSLLFPVDRFAVNGSSPPTYSISVVHHPFNWFSQPTTLRPLRDKIEHASDMVITGHEHGNVGFTKTPIGTTGVLQYLEGGVLQERNDESISSFAVLVFDFKNQQQRIVRLLLNKDEGIYVRQPGADPTPLRVNMSRKDRRFQISAEFREFLDDPDLPLADSKQRAIRLLDIFTYPDLKEAVGTAIERRWKLFKGERVLDELLTRRRVLIAASPKAGKTSLAKSLFVDLLSNRQLPVYIDGEDLPAVITDQTARQALGKAIKRQYAAATIEAYEQYAGAKRALIIDNLEAIDDARGGRERFLNFVDGRFDLIIAFADDEFVLEHFHARQGSSRKIVEYDCFYICEFGYISIEDLARRWLLSSQSAGSHVTEETIRDICKIVGRVLQINAIPHHPWVLIVLLQEASSGQEIAAKNGSYGHLFQAIVTGALYRSRFHNVDIETKYNYLAEFACAMFEQGVATFDEAEAKRFHESHCDRYDLDLSFDQMKADLIEIGIMRSDAGRLAFRTKYSYWFFVAWYLSRHMHKPDVQHVIERLCGRLHHEDTANIFIFLAHLSNEPHVLMSIVQTAKTLFADCPPVALDEDIKEINLLHPDEIRLRLPSTDAEENRRSLMAEKDREIAQRDASVTDGRRVEATAPATNDPGDDFTKYIRALQASMKTIDILGQVLRNGAGSIDAAEKREIVDEIYRLARRVNGSVLQDLPNQLTSFANALSRHFEVKYPNDTPDMRINRIVGHITHLFWLVTFALVRRVSHSLAHEMLRRTFDKVLAADGCIPNRLFDLSIKLDVAQGLPSNEAQTLYNDVAGNVLVRTVIRALIINHLYLYSVPENERQAICEKLDIEIDEHSQSLDPDRKKVRGLLSGPHSRMDGDERKAARKRKKEERKRRNR